MQPRESASGERSQTGDVEAKECVPPQEIDCVRKEKECLVQDDECFVEPESQD